MNVVNGKEFLNYRFGRDHLDVGAHNNPTFGLECMYYEIGHKSVVNSFFTSDFSLKGESFKILTLLNEIRVKNNRKYSIC